MKKMKEAIKTEITQDDGNQQLDPELEKIPELIN